MVNSVNDRTIYFMDKHRNQKGGFCLWNKNQDAILYKKFVLGTHLIGLKLLSFILSNKIIISVKLGLYYGSSFQTYAKCCKYVCKVCYDP